MLKNVGQTKHIYCRTQVEKKRKIVYTTKKKGKRSFSAMKEFKYVVTDTEGIHARPAGLLVKKQENLHLP